MNGDAGFVAGLVIVRPGLRGRVVAHVVPVAVGGNDELQLPAALLERTAQPGNRWYRRVDGDRFVSASVTEDIDIGRDRSDCPAEQLHARRLARSPADPAVAAGRSSSSRQPGLGVPRRRRDFEALVELLIEASVLRAGPKVVRRRVQDLEKRDEARGIYV